MIKDFAEFEQYLRDHHECFVYDAENPTGHRPLKDLELPKKLSDMIAEISYAYWLAYLKHYHKWYTQAGADGTAYEST